MPEPRYNLTEADVVLLREMADEYRRQRIGQPPRHTGKPQEPTAPEVYVAWVPSGGIPALNDQDTTGTGTEEGTGTGSSQLDDVVGSAVCEIYHMVVDGFGNRRLHRTGFTKRVHNLMTVGVPGSKWALISRDKFGAWWVSPILLDLSECP